MCAVCACNMKYISPYVSLCHYTHTSRTNIKQCIMHTTQAQNKIIIKKETRKEKNKTSFQFLFFFFFFLQVAIFFSIYKSGWFSEISGNMGKSHALATGVPTRICHCTRTNTLLHTDNTLKRQWG